MAILKSHSAQVELPDGEYIMEAAEALGVPFGCERGVCGTCMVEIISGLENLSEPSKSEQLLECTGNERLACQCKIMQGDVLMNRD